MPASTRRLASLTTALVLATSGVLALGAPTAQADDVRPARGSADPVASPTAAGPTADRAPRAAAPTERRLVSGGDGRRRAERTVWPVRSRSGTLTIHSVPPSGDLSQQLASAHVVQDRLTGWVRADLRLRAAPSSATQAAFRVFFGQVVPSGGGTACQSRAGWYDVPRYTHGVGGAYQGARIVHSVRLPATRTGTINCAFVDIYSVDGATLHDSVSGHLTDHRQPPALSIKVAGRTLSKRGFTRVPMTISNSRNTVATAPAIRLSWRTKGVAVRGDRTVGTIRPGQSRKGAIFVKDTRRGVGKIWLTVRSRTYQRTVVLVVREVRR